jgi:hypothetical protein
MVHLVPFGFLFILCKPILEISLRIDTTLINLETLIGLKTDHYGPVFLDLFHHFIFVTTTVSTTNIITISHLKVTFEFSVQWVVALSHFSFSSIFSIFFLNNMIFCAEFLDQIGVASITALILD